MDDNLNLNIGGGHQDLGIELNAQPVQPTVAQQSSQGSAQPIASQQSYQSYAPPSGEPVHSGMHAEAQGGAYHSYQYAQSAPAAAAPAAAAADTAATPPSTPSDPSHATAKKGSSGGKTFLIAFAGALVACALAFGVALGFGLMGPASYSGSHSLGAAESTSIEAVDVEESLAEAVANKCLPSVVSIDVYARQQSQASSIYDYLYGYGYGNNNSGELTETGLGSGVILSDDGYIITNNHVIDGGEQFKVTIEGDVYEAELIGSEASADVAVLKVKDGSDFQAIEIGDSDNIKVGEWVMSLGSPFGLEQSVATGIVSATSRSQIMNSSSGSYGGSGETTIYPNLIQTDAAINPGNSGGALVDANGALIGINTLITSYSGNYSGVGFAIPSNYAISLAQSIIAGEEPTYAQLGITMTTIDSSIAKRYGFSVDSGAYVSSVAEGSGAANAGIQVGDIITSFDGKKVSSSSDLMLDVRSKQPGDVVTIKADRDGEEMEFQVTLGKSEASAQAQQEEQDASSNGNEGSNSGNGGYGYGYGNGNGYGGSIEDFLRQFGR